ncbi:hypothetical protein [Roseixanthobacter glucoisosaccharinicivorans]|uniref:hypothetical protein n=1 Tax=Roseixanthobacter glucoisosaccharinicivorans TaxID=3119923 RepID=UPI00372A9658
MPWIDPLTHFRARIFAAAPACRDPHRRRLGAALPRAVSVRAGAPARKSHLPPFARIVAVRGAPCHKFHPSKAGE